MVDNPGINHSADVYNQSVGVLKVYENGDMSDQSFHRDFSSEYSLIFPQHFSDRTTIRTLVQLVFAGMFDRMSRIKAGLFL